MWVAHDVVVVSFLWDVWRTSPFFLAVLGANFYAVHSVYPSRTLTRIPHYCSRLFGLSVFLFSVCGILMAQLHHSCRHSFWKLSWVDTCIIHAGAEGKQRQKPSWSAPALSVNYSMEDFSHSMFVSSVISMYMWWNSHHTSGTAQSHTHRLKHLFSQTLFYHHKRQTLHAVTMRTKKGDSSQSDSESRTQPHANVLIFCVMSVSRLHNYRGNMPKAWVSVWAVYMHMNESGPFSLWVYILRMNVLCLSTCAQAEGLFSVSREHKFSYFFSDCEEADLPTSP